MVQLETTALITKATENNRIIRRHQARSTSFSEGSAFTLSGLEQDKILPVFVYPQVLYFYANDTKSLTQEVNVYNPYEWPIKFKVFVTAPGKWEIREPEGVISPSYMFELKIRLIDRSPSLIGTTDHLRIVMQTVTDSKKLGKRDLTCKFLAEKDCQEEEMQKQCTDPALLHVDRFAFQNKSIETSPPTVKKPQEIATTAKSAASKSDTQGANRNKSKNEPTSSWPPSAYVFTAIMCGIILCLPTEECILPAYLVISHTPKYIAAYVLGKHFSTAKQTLPKQIGIDLV